MRTLRLLLISLVLAATGCPNSDSSTPPVTGLVLGGPTLGGGGGVVSVEVSTAVAGTTVMLENLTRGTQPASTVADSSVPFVTVSIAADVADRLRVSFTDLVQGPVTAEVTVPSPRIVEIRDINESAPVVHAGAAAQITGEGFSADPNAAGAVSNPPIRPRPRRPMSAHPSLSPSRLPELLQFAICRYANSCIANNNTLRNSS